MRISPRMAILGVIHTRFTLPRRSLGLILTQYDIESRPLDIIFSWSVIHHLSLFDP